MVQVFAALNFVHAQKIIHRDIKPGNVFLIKAESDVVEKAVVGDFGLARPLDKTCQLVNTRIGTPSYVSPEIAMAEPYTYKTDIFSAGATFYEVMTLERAFWKKGYTEKQSLRDISYHDPTPRLQELCKTTYDKDILRIVTACLAKHEKYRPTAFDVLCSFSVKLTRYVKTNNILVYKGSGTSPVRVTTPKERVSPVKEPRRTPSPAVPVPEDEPTALHPGAAGGGKDMNKSEIVDGSQLASLLMAHCTSEEDADLLKLLDNDYELFALVKVITVTRRHNLDSMENAVFKVLFALKPTVQIQKAVDLLSRKFGSRPCEG
ncbi:protein kinase [Strigomonas culicis]|nr:protein kinase [Strigomonas culicis]|eukprot:EPY24834.1 protein kinase [Strigomonas culicis]